MLKYKNFIKIYENNPDPFNEENWDEIDNYDNNEDEDIVIDYYGYEINRDNAYFIDGYFFSIDDLKWSEYDQIYYSPINDDIIFVDSPWGGDYIHRDDALRSIKHNNYFHPDDQNIVYVDNDWVYDTDTVYSEYKSDYILKENSVYCEHDNDYIPIEHAIKLEDGTFTIIDNVVKKDDKLYHKNTINK